MPARRSGSTTGVGKRSPPSCREAYRPDIDLNAWYMLEQTAGGPRATCTDLTEWLELGAREKAT